MSASGRKRISESAQHLAATSLEVISEHRIAASMWMMVLSLVVFVLLVASQHKAFDTSGYIYTTFMFLLSGYAAYLLYETKTELGLSSKTQHTKL